MTTVDIAFDVLARLPSEGGRKVRVLVLLPDYDKPPADIRIVGDTGSGVEELYQEDVQSISINTPHSWTVHRTDGSSFPLDVTGGCQTCGGGRLSILDPLPGYERRMVRVPDWLKQAEQVEQT